MRRAPQGLERYDGAMTATGEVLASADLLDRIMQAVANSGETQSRTMAAIAMQSRVLYRTIVQLLLARFELVERNIDESKLSDQDVEKLQYVRAKMGRHDDQSTSADGKNRANVTIANVIYKFILRGLFFSPLTACRQTSALSRLWAQAHGFPRLFYRDPMPGERSPITNNKVAMGRFVKRQTDMVPRELQSASSAYTQLLFSRVPPPRAPKASKRPLHCHVLTHMQEGTATRGCELLFATIMGETLIGANQLSVTAVPSELWDTDAATEGEEGRGAWHLTITQQDPLLVRVIKTFAKGRIAWNDFLSKMPEETRFERHDRHILPISEPIQWPAPMSRSGFFGFIPSDWDLPLAVPQFQNDKRAVRTQLRQAEVAWFADKTPRIGAELFNQTDLIVSKFLDMTVFCDGPPTGELEIRALSEMSRLESTSCKRKIHPNPFCRCEHQCYVTLSSFKDQLRFERSLRPILDAKDIYLINALRSRGLNVVEKVSLTNEVLGRGKFGSVVNFIPGYRLRDKFC